MSPNNLQQQFHQEFSALQHHPGIILAISAIEAWAIFSQLQLAFRHPANTGPTQQIAENIARQLQSILATTPALAKVAQRGWDSDFNEVP